MKKIAYTIAFSFLLGLALSACKTMDEYHCKADKGNIRSVSEKRYLE